MRTPRDGRLIRAGYGVSWYLVGMGNSDERFVAIIGGFYDLDAEAPQKGREARELAEKLGAELAKARLGLVV